MSRCMLLAAFLFASTAGFEARRRKPPGVKRIGNDLVLDEAYDLTPAQIAMLTEPSPLRTRTSA